MWSFLLQVSFLNNQCILSQIHTLDNTGEWKGAAGQVWQKASHKP